MVEKPSSVAYNYGQQPQQQGAGHVNYPSMPPPQQQQQQQQQQGGGGAPPFYPSQPPPPPPPPPSSNTFAVGTPAYYVDPYQQSQATTSSCVVGPQLWLFAFGWLFAPTFFVGAMLPACVPLRPGERGMWIANMVMAIVSFTLAIIIATTVPIMKYGMHGGGGGGVTYVYRG